MSDSFDFDENADMKNIALESVADGSTSSIAHTAEYRYYKEWEEHMFELKIQNSIKAGTVVEAKIPIGIGGCLSWSWSYLHITMNGK